MRGIVLLAVVFVAGVLLIVLAYRIQSTDLAELADIEPKPAEEAVEPEPPSDMGGLVLTDVYTSQAAAEAAYRKRAQMAQLAERMWSSTAKSNAPTESSPSQSFAGLFDTLQGEALPTDETTSPNEEKATPFPVEEPVPQALSTPTAREVTGVVEAFLKDAVERRDLQSYLSALDEEFQYTFDNGTPENVDDDRIFEAEAYRQMATTQLFRPDDVAEVTLSKPYDFELMGPDVATVSYDYDLRLWGTGAEARRFAGTAAFLLVRGSAGEEADAWRILEWVDAPPDPDRWMKQSEE